nr:hypothetical protein [Deltaproteobacteria bacterium]
PSQPAGQTTPSPPPPTVAPTPAPAAAAPPAAPATPPISARAQALVETIEALGQLHQTHATDCPALASAVEGFHREHADQLADQPPPLHAWIDSHDPLRTRLRTALEPVMTASMLCRADPAFAAVQAKLFPPPPSAER